LITVSGRLHASGQTRLPPAGAVLRREYRGVEHRVLVLPQGLEHEGKVYRSLSAVATAITGSHWNGYHFFGLSVKESKR